MMKHSLRSVITAVLLFAIVTLSTSAAFFALEIRRSVSEEITQTAFPTLHTVQILLEKDLQVVEKYLDSAAYDSTTLYLGSDSDFTGYYYASEDLHAVYSPLLAANSSISAVFIVQSDNLITHTIFGSLSGNTGVERFSAKDGIRQAVTEKISSGNIETDTWCNLSMPDTTLLYGAVYWAGRYSICLIDLNMAVNYYSTTYGIPGELMLAREGDILTDYTAGTAEILFDGQTSSYMLSEASRGLLLLQDQNSVLDLICLVPIGDLTANITALQWMMIFVTILLLSVFLSAYFYLKQNFIRPMNGLMTAMERIQSGNLDALPQAEYGSQEFSAIYVTFQKMIASLKEMKIQAYEKDLENQRIHINSLRLQIRPHFYLNCLKSIYSAAAMGNFDYVQDRIMHLSRHLRYCFSQCGDSVPLRDELTQCGNYMEMFNIGRSNHNRLRLDVEDELLDFQIPPMTILTAVENSVKYYSLKIQEDVPLQITISANTLRTEDRHIVNICIKDNGPGFSPEAMELIHHPNADHVGISNIAQQMKFFFGPSCEVAFTNQDGAQIDFFIPLDEKRSDDESVDR